MDNLVQLSNVRVASNPTFIPDADPNKHRCLVTVIKNRKTRDGRDLRDEFSLIFWGKYAQTAALYLEKGRAINVEGVLRSYSVDTGRVKANGKPEIYRITTVHVRSFEFSADSMKNLSARVTANLQKAKAEGLIPANATITADYLLATMPKPFVEYNPALVAQTGMYGNARVFIKGQGFVGPQNPAVQPAAQPVAPATPAAPAGNDMANQIAALQAQLAAMMNQQQPAAQPAQAASGQSEAVDPF